MADVAITAQMAIEYWKLLRAFDRMARRLPETHRAKAVSQARFSAGRFEALLRDAGFNLVTFDGQAFAPNLPAIALNADDFDGTVDLVVADTVEPAVLQGVQVLMMGKVMLAAADNGEQRVSGD
jgi:hypothetical protein